MANNKQNLYYVIAVIAVIVIVAVLMMRNNTPEVEPEPVVTEPEVVVEPEVVLPEAVEPTEYKGETEMVTQAACVDGTISGMITNIGSETVVLGKDMKILLRGMVVKEPGCDKEELAPGESATCMNLNGGFVTISGKNEVLLTLGAENGKATVSC